MITTFLVLFSALLLETLGSYISVVGLAAQTSMIVIILTIVLDFAKVMIATVLYKKWKQIHFLLKSFLVPSLLLLMSVTSSGTYAFLLQEFGKTTSSQEQSDVQLIAMKEEKVKLENRKKEIDGQILALPSNSVNARKRLSDLFKDELVRINDRIVQLDKEIPLASIKKIDDKGHGGTIVNLASAYDLPPDKVTRVIAFLIAMMIDPLAIVLLTISNFLINQNKKERKEILIKQIKGEMVDDEQALIRQLEAKLALQGNKTIEKPSFFGILGYKKHEVVKQPKMTGDKFKLNSTAFINSVIISESSKLIVPVKFSNVKQSVNSEKFLLSENLISKNIISTEKYNLPIIQFINNCHLTDKKLFSENKEMIFQSFSFNISKNIIKEIVNLKSINFINEVKLITPFFKDYEKIEINNFINDISFNNFLKSLTKENVEKIENIEFESDQTKEIYELNSSEFFNDVVIQKDLKELKLKKSLLLKENIIDIETTNFLNNIQKKIKQKNILQPVKNDVFDELQQFQKLKEYELETIYTDEDLIFGDEDFYSNEKTPEQIYLELRDLENKISNNEFLGFQLKELIK